MQLPGAIIFINDSITTAQVSTLVTDTGVQPGGLVQNTPYPSTTGTIDQQLQINETITFAEFNARVAADPNYPKVAHLNHLRILVILPDFHDQTNRHLADIVIFIKQGIASVEKNKFGPPGQSFDYQRLNIQNLIRSLKGKNDACFPFPGWLPPPQTQTPENPRPHEHLCPRPEEGLGTLELFGTEAVQSDDRDEGAFGGRLRRHQHYPEGATTKAEEREQRELCDCDDDEGAFGDDD